MKQTSGPKRTHLIVLVISFIIGSYFLNNWDAFERGLIGKNRKVSGFK